LGSLPYLGAPGYLKCVSVLLTVLLQIHLTATVSKMDLQQYIFMYFSK